MDWQFDIRKNVGLEMLLSEPGLESFSGREYFESDDNIDVNIKEESPNKCKKFKEEPKENFEEYGNKVHVKIKKEKSVNKRRQFKEESKENFEEYDDRVHVKIKKEESTDESRKGERESKANIDEYEKSVNKRRKIKHVSHNITTLTTKETVSQNTKKTIKARQILMSGETKEEPNEVKVKLLDAKVSKTKVDGDEANSNIGQLRAELQATRLQLKEAQEANDKLNYWAAFAAKKYEELTQIRLDSVQMKKEWEIAKKNKKEDLLLLKEAMEENDVKKSNNCKCYPLIKAYISTLDKWYSKDAEDGRWF